MYLLGVSQYIDDLATLNRKSKLQIRLSLDQLILAVFMSLTPIYIWYGYVRKRLANTFHAAFSPVRSEYLTVNVDYPGIATLT